MITTAPHTVPEPSRFEKREDVLSLIGFIAVAGPPPFVAVALAVFGVLMLVGPFAVIVTLVVGLLVVAAAVAALAMAVVVVARSPIVAVRCFRRHRQGNPFLLLGHRTHVATYRGRVAS
jgi:hypothetical protein